MSRTWIGGGELGLLPAMNPQHPATNEITRLWEAFKAKNLLKDVREQAALGLHASSIHPGGSGARLTDDNRVLLRAPDRLAKKVATRDELTFNDSRDMLSFSQTVLDEVGRIMDELLAVLERYARDRWTPPRHEREEG